MPIKMKVCNVAEYNESLKKRGMIFHYFNEAVKNWMHEAEKFTYSDKLIEITSIFRYLFKIPYRQLEGLLADYVANNNLNLPIPDFSTLQRRMSKLSSAIQDHRHTCARSSNESISILIDSSGINIYPTGGGHSKENRRYRRHKHYSQVRKMHVAVNPRNKKAVAIKMTGGTVSDSTVAPILMERIPGAIASVCADGAYDRIGVRSACAKRKARQIIPPSRVAVRRKAKRDEPADLWDDRNEAVSMMRQTQDREEGRRQWKNSKGYGKRSLVEAFFSRFKIIFGFCFMSRCEKSREVELAIKSNLLNTFKDLGGAAFERAA